MSFEDTIGEPDDIKTSRCCWNLSICCYNAFLKCCYGFFACVGALPMTMYWGCCFACTSWYHIWCMTPTLRMCQINCAVYRKCNVACVDAVLGPLFESCALCLSKIIVGRHDNGRSNGDLEASLVHTSKKAAPTEKRW